ncbi:MAG: chemotaxis protein CheW [Hydrogenophilales bacterium 17-61-9]|nr:MAG: chemotaxis protein CheW [Hydrogenophilales bacterium 17-61-9]
MKGREKAPPRKPGPAPVDWHAIRRRMEKEGGAIGHAWTPSSAETRRVLMARAQALGGAPTAAETPGEYIDVVEFVLAHERYAIESRYIREVAPLENLTPLPCTPSFVLGIVNLRGEILSVIDIKKFFDLPEHGLTDLNKIIVLQSGDMLFGILADAIAGVRRIPLADIQPSLPTLTGIREEYLTGVTAGRLVILDAEKLLTDESIVVREQVAG